jgi:hypothetical protein
MGCGSATLPAPAPEAAGADAGLGRRAAAPLEDASGQDSGTPPAPRPPRSVASFADGERGTVRPGYSCKYDGGDSEVKEVWGDTVSLVQAGDGRPVNADLVLVRERRYITSAEGPGTVTVRESQYHRGSDRQRSVCQSRKTGSPPTAAVRRIWRESLRPRRDLKPRYLRERVDRAFFRPAWNLSETPRSMKLRDRPSQIRLKSEGFVHTVFLILSNLKATGFWTGSSGLLA